jgi:threonine dehydrogenase-like Zn-dependent dehydrogenase
MIHGTFRLALGAAIAIFCVQGSAYSQTPVASASAELATAFDVIAADLHAAAAKMPSDNYAFRPVEGVRSFGQVIAHVSGAHFLYCSEAAGRGLDATVLKTLKAVRPFSDVSTAGTVRTPEKDELVSLLADSITFCKTVYATGSGSIRPLIGNIAHDNEHYGNLVTYLRLKGFVPPSSERKGAGGR